MPNQEKLDELLVERKELEKLILQMKKQKDFTRDFIRF